MALTRALVFLAIATQLTTAAASMLKLFGLIDADSNGVLSTDEARVLVALNFDVEPHDVPDEVVAGGKSGAMDADGKSFVDADYDKFTELLDGADAEAFEEILAAASARQDL